MRFRALVAVLCLFAPLAAAAHGPSVKLSYGRVTPPSLAIHAGDTVHFHNHGTTPRVFTVRGDDDAFESPPLARGEGWHHTFEEPGSYGYGVAEVPGMRGTIVVVPKDD
ncbi:MAG: cupredoxin domain-containing protein [Myxococcota bacterium]